MIESNRATEVAIRTTSHVLITGPTGTGKSRLAERIHREGPRREKAFVVVNLASIHAGTLESELFGHERGAFTSASVKRTGRVWEANGGTLFLDEIGELPPHLQARLLELIQSRSFTPVGGNRPLRVDARIIAATNQDLEKAVRAGTFREDLWHRLRVVSIDLLPLKDRADELDGIVHDLLAEASARLGRSVTRISDEVVLAFERDSWPGNLRELGNVLEYALACADDGVIRMRDLPPWFVDRARVQVPMAEVRFGVAEFPLLGSYRATMARFEREYLCRVLDRFDGRVSKAAREVGLPKTTMLRRIRAREIKREAVT